MSHQNTPHLHLNRVPGSMPSDTPSGHPSGPNDSAAPVNPLDSSRSVSDSVAANAKQLLNAYIYDFLIKNTLPNTARSFITEADLPSIPNGSSHSSSTNASPSLNNNNNNNNNSSANNNHVSASNGSSNNRPNSNNIPVSQNSTPRIPFPHFDDPHLPKLALSMDAPQGMLFEWWQVFWDVFNARNDKASSALAAQYYQMQLMKQRQHHEMLGMEMLAGPNPQMLLLLQPQTQQQQQQQQQQNQPQQLAAATAGSTGPLHLAQGAPASGQMPPQLFQGPHGPLGQLSQQMPVIHPNQQLPFQMMGMGGQAQAMMRNPQAMQRQMMVDPRQQQRYLMMMKQQQLSQQQQAQQLLQLLQLQNQQQNQQPQQPQQQQLQQTPQQNPLGPPLALQNLQQLNLQNNLNSGLQSGLQPGLQPGSQANSQPQLATMPMPMGQDSQMPMGGMNMGMNMNIPQQMFMQQQQQQQHQQNASGVQHPQLLLQHIQTPQIQGPQPGPHQTPHNRIQEHAQTQMNNLRQQAAVSALHGQHQQPGQQQLPSHLQQAQQQQQQQQQGPNNNSGSSQPQSRESGSPLTMNMNAPRGKQQARQVRPPQQNQNMMQAFGQPSNMVDGSVGSPLAMSNPQPGAKAGPGANVAPKVPSGPPNRNSNALQDYQMQLMMLEKQNKKRLDIARNTGGGDLGIMPQMQQLPPGGATVLMENLAPPKASPAPSPNLHNKASPMSGGAGKAKKTQPGKKGRKPSAINTTGAGSNGSSSVANTPGSTSGIGGGVKKENVTPLTPAAEVDMSNKKKRKSLAAKSPAKKVATGKDKNDESGPAKKELDDDRFDPDIMDASGLDKKPDFTDDDTRGQPSSMYFQSLGGNDKMISVDILGGSGGGDGSNLFNTGGNSGIDDIDFEFNNLLDGGDGGLNDSITGFNWGNPIEGSD